MLIATDKLATVDGLRQKALWTVAIEVLRSEQDLTSSMRKNVDGPRLGNGMPKRNVGDGIVASMHHSG